MAAALPCCTNARSRRTRLGVIALARSGGYPSRMRCAVPGAPLPRGAKGARPCLTALLCSGERGDVPHACQPPSHGISARPRPQSRRSGTSARAALVRIHRIKHTTRACRPGSQTRRFSILPCRRAPGGRERSESGAGGGCTLHPTSNGPRGHAAPCRPRKAERRRSGLPLRLGDAAGVPPGPGVVGRGHQKDRDAEAVDALRERESHLATQHCVAPPSTVIF